MKDPHVERLHYRLVHDDSVTYADCEPVEHETDAFALRLADSELSVEMREHFPTPEGARESVELFLLGWQIHVALQDRGVFDFVYSHADVIDQDPNPATHATLHLQVGEKVTAFSDLPTTRVERSRYPAPPAGFVVSPDVETLWRRYKGSVDGREPVASMAYFCLTVVTNVPGGRRAAASLLGVSDGLLKKIGELTARGRKHLPQEDPLSAAEDAWLDGAVKLLIRRVGEVAADPSTAASTITLRDHPLPRS